MGKTNSKKAKIALIISLAVILAILIFCIVYVNDYYHTDDEVVSAFLTDTQNVQYCDDYITVIPENPRAGIIFYPGGKVEYSAYLPLADELCEKGIACVIVKMPFNLAVLGVNKADTVIEELDGIENWYIGGHSLGGSMASTYASKNDDKVKGVVLLGAYSSTDISDTGLDVISIYGSCDRIMNLEKYEQYKSNLPSDFEEYIIDGGNHAYFGAYGEQNGDGEAKITRESQIEQSTALISNFIK